MFVEFFALITIDLVSIVLHKIFLPSEGNISPNTRWFFIHSVINSIVSYYNFWDIKYCIENASECYLADASENAVWATNFAVLMHAYHLVFFYNHLTNQDWFHHIIMCGIDAPILYFYNKKFQTAAAFFLTGFPGMIDYFLLWCVKMKFLDPMIEKQAYVWISTWVRSPGCILTSLFAIPFFTESDNIIDEIVAFFGILLNFWNGQYYMMLTCVDYGKKLKIK